MNSNYVELTDIFPEIPQKLEKPIQYIELLENLDNTIKEKAKIIFNWSSISQKYFRESGRRKHKYADFLGEVSEKGCIVLTESGYNLDNILKEDSIIPEDVMRGGVLDILKTQHTLYLFLSDMYRDVYAPFEEYKNSLQESIDSINTNISNSKKSIENRKSYVFKELTKDAQNKLDDASVKYRTLLAENKNMSNALSVIEECFEWKDIRKMFMWHKLPEKTKTNLDFFGDSARMKYADAYSSMSRIKNTGQNMSMNTFYELYQITIDLKEPRKNLEQAKINAEKYMNTDFIQKDEQAQILNEKIKSLQKEKKECVNKIGKINTYMGSTEKTILKINQDIENITSEFEEDVLREKAIKLIKNISQNGIFQTIDEFIDTCPYKRPIEINNAPINPTAIKQPTLKLFR